MPTTRRQWLPDRTAVLGAIGNAAVVGAALYVFEGTVSYALGAAGIALVLNLCTALANALVGDYADHVLLGVVVLAGTGYLVTLSPPWWVVAGGAVVGGWFLLDGVQHRRYDLTRGMVGTPYHHDGSVVTGLPKALLVRLFEPVTLSTRRLSDSHGKERR